MINSQKFYYKKEIHTELAEELNRLASNKNVQVSRWVNNSKGRQIVTYMVHTGERNEFASRQENVLFKTSVDAGRNNRVRDEQSMMTDVRQYLNSIPVDEPETEDLYEITSDLFGDCEPSTITEITEIVEMWESDGWRYEVEVCGDELRLYAYRENSDNYTPSVYTPWVMVTDDYGYLVIGEEIES
jgi:hypothetical protein